MLGSLGLPPRPTLLPDADADADGARTGGGDEERRKERECPPGHILSDADADDCKPSGTTPTVAARSRQEGAGDVAAGKQPPDVFAKRTRDPTPTRRSRYATGDGMGRRRQPPTGRME